MALKDLLEAAVGAVASAAKKSSGTTTPASTGGSGASASSGSGYRPLDTSGNDYAGMVGMSDLDRAALDAAKQSYADAQKAGDQAGMDAAHRQAEQLRAQYGYSGGSDGSQYLPFAQAKQSNERFTYESAPSYTSKYQSQIDDLTRQILEREAFSYDPETDPLYQQYKESYTRNGQRAMQDTMGQMAARTGGLASSYAGAAAQQTFDNYMGALADKIPELQQLAYSMYMDEGNTQRANLEMLQALEAGDYAKYQDLLSQYNTDRGFSYGVFSDQKNYDYQLERDRVDDMRYNDETIYGREQDALDRAAQEDETAWQRSQYTSEKEYEQALQKAQTLAAAGDFSGYKALGYTDAEIANLKSAYDRAQALAAMGGSSGGSGGSSSRRSSGSGSRSSGSGSAGGNKWAAVEDWVSRFGEDAAEDYIKENYKALGYSSQSAALSGWKNHLLESGSSGKSSGSSGGGDSYSLEDLNIGAVLQLGIGPVSYQTVEDLVEQGKVDVYTDSNGKLSVRWASGWNAKNYKNSSGGGLPGLPGLTNPLGR